MTGIIIVVIVLLVAWYFLKGRRKSKATEVEETPATERLARTPEQKNCIKYFTASGCLAGLSKMKDTELRNSGKMELKVQALKIIMPLKVQAYERFLLYLERVQLPQLVKRVYTPGMEKGTFHLILLQNVREEFEHNLAQQLYVSNSTWIAVVNAKEELVNQINTTFEQLKDEEDVSILAQSLVALPNPMVEQAVAVLKRDFERLL